METITQSGEELRLMFHNDREAFNALADAMAVRLGAKMGTALHVAFIAIYAHDPRTVRITIVDTNRNLVAVYCVDGYEEFSEEQAQKKALHSLLTPFHIQ